MMTDTSNQGTWKQRQHSPHMCGFIFHTSSRLRPAWIERISATSPGSKTGPETSPDSETTSTPSLVASAAAAAEAWPVAGAGQASSVSSRQEATRVVAAGMLERKASGGDASPVAQGVNLRGRGKWGGQRARGLEQGKAVGGCGRGRCR